MIYYFVGSYRFLSNFYGAPVELYGEVFPSVEHAFQAAKWPPVKGDKRTSYAHQVYRQRIRECRTPGEAKKMGGLRDSALPIRADWDAFRVEAMKTLLTRKFAGPKLRSLLLLTGDEELVEGNRHGDRDWGAIVVKTEEGREQVLAEYPGAKVWLEHPEGRTGWLVGRNMLGIALMEVRSALNGEEA